VEVDGLVMVYVPAERERPLAVYIVFEVVAVNVCFKLPEDEAAGNTVVAITLSPLR
jgi:hypothetical protein